MLGTDLVRIVGAQEELIGLGRGVNRNPGLKYFECDIRNRDQVLSLVSGLSLDWVIHCAAYTRVDECERNVREAEAANVLGAENVAEACLKSKIRAILLSTDYIFDGKKNGPYDESDVPGPLSVYGRTKLEAEMIWQRTLKFGMIIRSSWMFGAHGKNFVKTIYEIASKGVMFPVVCDQWGCPTYTVDLAGAILHLLRSAQTTQAQFPQVLHYTNSGATSRYEWAKFIVRQMGLEPNLVKPVSTAETNRPARRPKYGVLGTGLWKKFFKDSPRDIWQATSEYMRESNSVTTASLDQPLRG